MNICANCFADQELKAFISSSDKKKNCPTCSTIATSVIDVSELFDFFQDLVDNFEVVGNGESLKNKIQGNWSFFANHQVAEKILNYLLPKLKTAIGNANSPVDYIQEIKDNSSYWETLKEELKWSNRFLSDLGQLVELGWDSFFNTQYRLTPSTELFRARVHHQSGNPALSNTDMFCPPPHLANGGRANPMGIPYLYLCDNAETVLYEVRASYLDELSIATFRLKKDLTDTIIVDFTEDTPLFQPESVRETIMAKLLRDRISQDLSKPMRRYDSEIEYIPTQFICEFIRTITGASGIRFSSSLHPQGKNIVIFNQNLMECADVVLHQVTTVNLESTGLTP